mgnify:CR=1 FL=1|jgi:hypothetical protein|tara:strand:- start:30 stop:1499 length:1470 start_codon:yes stop_codon:yes gene_type:complete
MKDSKYTNQTKSSLLKHLIVITLIPFLFFQTGYAQKKISKSNLKQDLTILKRNLEELHGGLYTYSSKKEINDWFFSTSEHLKDSMGTFEFYRLLAPLNSILKNGHTNVSYPSFGDNFYFLPIQLYKYKESFYIKKSFSKQHSELEGVQILEINGIPIDEIFNRLLKNQTRDGNNLSMPDENLSNLFGLEYSIVYGTTPNYDLTLYKENKRFQVSLPHKLLNREVIKEYNNGKKLKSLSFEMSEKISVLNFPTFNAKKLKKSNYKALLKASFAEIKAKNIEHLIIDVRNNGGGDPIPTQELISYLIDEKFVMYKDVYTKTNKIKDRKYYKKQGVFLLNLFSWLKVKKISDNHYRRRNKEGMDVYSPKENIFKGQLYILTNGNSFSATGEFTSFIKHYRSNAYFVGEEVGGNEFQNTSGVSYTITLPNSKQKVTIPLVVFEMNIDSKNSGHGIKPNHWVRNTNENELNGEDSVMGFTLELIKKSMANNGYN